MSKASVGWCVAIFICGICLGAPFVNAQKPEGKQTPGLVRHVVLFKFKDGTTKEQLREITDAFAALPGKIDAIKDFEWGTDISVEEKAQGFTHCFLVSFADAKGRDEYLPHAAHKDFVKIAGPRIDKVLVFDFAGRK